jgi:hypothetical protein
VCQQIASQDDQATDLVSTPPAPPWERQWANYIKAQRHLLNLAMLEAQAEAEISPMHVVQRDETLATIARVRPTQLSIINI